MGWKDKVNIIFLIIYFIMSSILILLAIDEVLISIGIPSCNTTCEVFIFYFIIPIGLIMGLVAYITSYKAIILKLIPLSLFLIILFLSKIIFKDGGFDFALAITMAVTFVYVIILLIITGIANFISKKLNKQI